MAKYYLHHVNLPQLKEQNMVYPRLVSQETIDLQELIKDLCTANGIPFEKTQMFTQQVLDQIINELADGKSVKIKDFGYFSISLCAKKHQTAQKEKTSTGNEQDIMIDNICFHPHKHSLEQVKQKCCLVCDEKEQTTYSSQQYTLEQRQQMALEHLRKQHVLTVAQYETMTGLKHNKAAQELKAMAEYPNSPITTHGERTHKIYVLKNGEFL